VVTDEKIAGGNQGGGDRRTIQRARQNGVFPIFTLACYLALIMYFKSKGGYKPVQLDSK